MTTRTNRQYQSCLKNRWCTDQKLELSDWEAVFVLLWAWSNALRNSFLNTQWQLKNESCTCICSSLNASTTKLPNMCCSIVQFLLLSSQFYFHSHKLERNLSHKPYVTCESQHWLQNVWNSVPWTNTSLLFSSPLQASQEHLEQHTVMSAQEN